jgi:hypothetical protein
MYNELCGSDWYAEFVVQHVAVHIPPVVLTGTQSSVYNTLQFIFHQLFWLVRREQLVEYELQRAVQRTLRTSQNNWWNMNCRVLYTELCVPVRTTGGIWTATCSTKNSAYHSQVVLTGTQSSVYSTVQFIFHQLFWLVRRVRCPARYSSYFTNFPDYDMLR